MGSLRIAFRNATRQGKRSLLLGGAIAFGVMVVLVLGGFTRGLLAAVRENATAMLGGHVYVRGEELTATGRAVSRIRDTELLDGALSVLDGEGLVVQRRSRARGDLIFGSRQAVVLVEGVDWSREGGLWDGLAVLRGDRNLLEAADAVVLPAETASRLGVEVGETVLFRVSTIEGQANVGDFRVAGVYEEQQGLAVSYAYAGLARLNGLIGLAAGECQSLNVTLASLEGMDAAAELLRRELAARGASVTEPEAVSGSFTGLRALLLAPTADAARGKEAWRGTRFSVSTLNGVLEPLLSLIDTLELVRVGLYVLLLSIIVAGLLNSFRMILTERTREIGTMRALGMQRGGVRAAFLLEALLLALAGAGAGTAAASLLAAVLGRVRLTGIPGLGLFTRQGRFALEIGVSDALLTLGLLLGSTLLSAWLPARAASRLEPADALRADR